MVKQGLNPHYNATREIPSFEEVAQQMHIERLSTWKNAKHGVQWINTLQRLRLIENRPRAGGKHRSARGADVSFPDLDRKT